MHEHTDWPMPLFAAEKRPVWRSVRSTVLYLVCLLFMAVCAFVAPTWQTPEATPSGPGRANKQAASPLVVAEPPKAFRSTRTASTKGTATRGPRERN